MSTLVVAPEDRDPKRSFTDYEKSYIYEQQNGKCTRCESPLERYGHSHHVIPHSEGGSTSVENLALVCDGCHIETHKELRSAVLKTNTGLSAREWQAECLREILPLKNANVVACPAAGKTFLGGFWARSVSSESNPFILIVSPSRNVRSGWRDDLTAHFGLQIDERWNGGGLSPDFHGASICYSSVGKSSVLAYLRMVAKDRGLVLILDEIHHGSEKNEWGSSLADLVSISKRALMLTGTPFRTDGEKIPSLRYEASGIVEPDYKYNYTKAIADGVCRSVVFKLCDGEATYSLNGEVSSVKASEVLECDAAKVANTLYGDSTEHMHELVSRTVYWLDDVRKQKPDAAALFVCKPSGNNMETSEQEDSRVEMVAKKIKEITGEDAVVVTSKDDNAQEKLKAFKHSSSKYLVAINMVCEGVNIPRLQVAGLFRYVQSEMLFRQLFGPGRIGRQTPDSEAEEGIVVLSDLPTHREFVSIIESESKAGIRQRQEREESLSSEIRTPNPDYDFTPISATFEESDTFSREQSLDPEMAEKVAKIQRHVSSKTGRAVTTDIAAALFGAVDLLGDTMPQEKPAEVIDVMAQEKTLRKRLTKLVGKIAYATRFEYKDIYTRLHKMMGYRNIEDAISSSGLAALDEYVLKAEQWLVDVKTGAANAN